VPPAAPPPTPAMDTHVLRAITDPGSRP
jgi:hypothetical protein